MRVTVTATALCMTIVGLCAADNVHASMKQPTNIPAQPLARALQSLAKDRNFQIVYATEEVGDRRTGGASGEYTSEEALKQLLSGTGLTYKFLDEKTVTVLPQDRASSAKSPRLMRGDSGDGADESSAKPEGPSPAFWSRLRLAQASQGGSGQSGALESSNDSPDSRSKSVELQEIVVTATKRTEVLSKVPISIAAYNRDALEASGVKSVVDLATLTPGVEFDNSSGFGPGTLTNIAIRGINSSVGTSTTGIYVDDTPVQSRITALSYFGNPLPLMFDVDRVEVARGPQGTLFGAGAEGGALRFVSPDPGMTRYTGFARAEVGMTRYGTPSYEGGAAVGGPVIDNQLGFRASAWYRRDGGYVDHIDPVTGSSIEPNSNWSRSYAVRGALAGKATDNVKLTFSIYAQSIHNHDSSVWFEYLSNPGSGRFINGRLLGQPNTDRLFLPSLKVDADLGFASLTSVTSYVNRHGDLLDDNTSFTAATFGGLVNYGSPLGFIYPTSYAQAVPTRLLSTVNQISEEVRLASNDPAAALRWTAGIYYSSTRQLDGEAVSAPYVAENVFGVPGDTPFLDTSLVSRDKQYAAFGQIDYQIIAGLTLTAGLRIARTDAAFTEAQAGLIAATEFPYAQGDEKETPVTPKLGLSYQIDEANMVYVSAGKGYRVGGGNQPIPLASPSNPAGCPIDREPGSYQSDSLWSYEIGAKDRLFGGRLRLDMSAFHTDWTNIQQQVFMPVCGFGYVANTGKATVNGFDIAFEAAPVDALILGLSLAYTDAYFTKTVMVNGALLARSGDAIGNPPNVVSPWSATTSARYEFGLPTGQKVYLRAEDIFHSRNNGPFVSFDPQATSYSPQIPSNPSTNVINLRAGVIWSQLDMSLFVNNVTSAHPALSRYQDTPVSTLFTDSTLRPRTVGITGSYRF